MANAAPGGGSTVEAVPESALVSPAYQVITLDSPLGGAVYSFLEATGRVWSVVSSSVDALAMYPNPSTFGMKTPTLRWINGDQIKDVFVDGMTTADFLKASGLHIDMSQKTGFVVSKRISRMMRPYFAAGFYPDEAVFETWLNYLETEGHQRGLIQPCLGYMLSVQGVTLDSGKWTTLITEGLAKGAICLP